jgi:hypothetical protein
LVVIDVSRKPYFLQSNRVDGHDLPQDRVRLPHQAVANGLSAGLDAGMGAQD